MENIKLRKPFHLDYVISFQLVFYGFSLQKRSVYANGRFKHFPPLAKILKRVFIPDKLLTGPKLEQCFAV